MLLSAREGMADGLAKRLPGIKLARVGTTGRVPRNIWPCRSVAASTPRPYPLTIPFPKNSAGMVVMARRMLGLVSAAWRLEVERPDPNPNGRSPPPKLLM
jgi:hypothetical protein